MRRCIIIVADAHQCAPYRRRVGIDADQANNRTDP